MKLRRHLAPLGLSLVILAACGSKEKDTDATATAEAAADVESDDASDDTAGEGAAAAEAANPAAAKDEGATTPVRDRKRDRAEKLGEAGAGPRERRNERLIRRAGDEADADGVAKVGTEPGDALNAGPRIVKPQRPAVGDRPAPVAEGDAPAVAVTPGVKTAETSAEKPVAPVADATAEPLQIETPQPARPAAVAPTLNLPAPDVTRLLPITVAAEILAQKNLKELGPLAGIATVSGYNSTHYSTASDRFGVAVQVWQDGTLRETEDRFRRMRLQHPNAEDVEVLKPVKGFYAGYQAIQSLTFVRPDKQMVVTVSCGEKSCDHGQLLRLARAVQGRI